MSTKSLSNPKTGTKKQIFEDTNCDNKTTPELESGDQSNLLKVPKLVRRDASASFGDLSYLDDTDINDIKSKYLTNIDASSEIILKNPMKIIELSGKNVSNTNNFDLLPRSESSCI